MHSKNKRYCIECGKDISYRGNRASRCENCQKEFRKAYQKRYWPRYYKTHSDEIKKRRKKHRKKYLKYYREKDWARLGGLYSMKGEPERRKDGSIDFEKEKKEIQKVKKAIFSQNHVSSTRYYKDEDGNEYDYSIIIAQNTFYNDDYTEILQTNEYGNTFTTVRQDETDEDIIEEDFNSDWRKKREEIYKGWRYYEE